MTDGHWHVVEIPIPEGLTTAAEVQAFLTEQASKLNDPPKVRVVTADQYQALPDASVVPGTDPTKAAVLDLGATATAGGTGQLFMCHNK